MNTKDKRFFWTHKTIGFVSLVNYPTVTNTLFAGKKKASYFDTRLSVIQFNRTF